MDGLENTTKKLYWQVMISEYLILTKNHLMNMVELYYLFQIKLILRNLDSKYFKMLNKLLKTTSNTINVKSLYRPYFEMRIVDLSRVDSMIIYNPNRDIIEDRK
jgi:hypothetical protein